MCGANDWYIEFLDFCFGDCVYLYYLHFSIFLYITCISQILSYNSHNIMQIFQMFLSNSALFLLFLIDTNTLLLPDFQLSKRKNLDYEVNLFFLVHVRDLNEITKIIVSVAQ